MTGKDDRSIVHRHMVQLFPNEFATVANAKAFLMKGRLVIHHAGGHKIQLVPDDLHLLAHSGGAAALRAAQKGSP